MLNLIESDLALFKRFLVVVIDVSDLHPQCILKDAVEVQLIRKFNIEVNITIVVQFVDIPKAIDPHLIVIFCVPVVV